MTDGPATEEPEISSLLNPGRNCWKAAKADRAAPLIDGAAYFAALRAALLRAQRQVLIMAWDIDGRIAFPAHDDADDGLPKTLCAFITELARERPDLTIHILLWDYTILYAQDRQPFPTINIDWATPGNVRLIFDDEIPIGGSHHQKAVVIDDRVAFVGGLDLTSGRWDTQRHAADEPYRNSPTGRYQGPFHDVQMIADGDLARAVGDECRRRWTARTSEKLTRPTDIGGDDPWPDHVEPAWRNIDIGVARTIPKTISRDQRREILALYLDAIARAKQTIYLENQFLTAEPVAEALERRLAEADGPEVVIITQWSTSSWLEEQVMGIRRHQFLARLENADEHGRLRAMAPCIPDLDLDAYNLHSKILVVDDCHVQIGSANVNNRSMGYDTEMDLALACRDADQRKAALDFRNALLAEHLGIAVEELAARIEEKGSVTAVIDDLRAPEGRTLCPLEYDEDPPEVIETVARLGDPERPVDIGHWLANLSPSVQMDQVAPLRQNLWKTLAVVAIIVGLIAAWHMTPLSRMLDPDSLSAALKDLRRSPWGPLAVVGLFIVGGFLLFPVTALILGTAIAFGPEMGLLYATLGALISASACYFAGFLAGKNFIRQLAGERVRRISRRLGSRGVLAVTALRVVPVAPFTVINLVAGASHIRYQDFLTGTVIGMVPGIAVLSLTGESIGKVFDNPTPGNVALLLALVGVWLGLGWLLQRAVDRFRDRGEKDGA